MYCDQCGTRNSADSKYCKECGAKIHVGFQTMMLSAQELSAVADPQGQERLTRLLDMAFWHNEAGNADAAIRACSAALQINPESTTAHSLLGSLYEKKGEDELAIRHFEAVLALNPDSEADAAKLDQLRQGIHSKPVTPSPVYRWLPPALAGVMETKLAEKASKVDWSALKISKLPALPEKRKPLVFAGAATAGVLLIGVLLVKPGPSRSEAQAQPAPVFKPVQVAARPTPAAAPPQTMKPMILKPQPLIPIDKVGWDPKANLQDKTDPFAQKGGLDVSALPTPSLGPRRRSARRGGRRGGRLADGYALPQLPVPPQNVSLRPLAVPAPPPQNVGDAPLPAAPIVQHTVPVNDLSGGGVPAPSAPAPSGRTPRIQITIDDAPATAPHRSESGEGYQQDALSRQNKGDYRGAKAAYQRAISAYKKQIEKGQDVDAAQSGLQASQTGLQICQQGQP